MNAILLRTSSAQWGFKAKRETPYRALGMLPIQVHQPDELITLQIDAPEKVEPEQKFSLKIQVIRVL